MYLAIDLGGTYIKHARIDRYGTIHDKGKEKTPATREELCRFILELSSSFPHCEGIAISSPGSVSNDTPIQGSSAITYIIGWSMKEELEELTRKPVHIENDANCAGVAEVWKGAAKGQRDVLVVVIGTGIGGAIIQDGHIHKGANLHGGEFGYMLISEQVDSSDDVWSRKASTKALVRKVAKKKRLNPDELTGEDVFQWADQGDMVAREAIEEFYHLLAIGLYNLQYIYDPDVILISGGVSARDTIIEELNKRVQSIIDKIDLATIAPIIRSSHFRQDANLLGAVYSFMKYRQHAVNPLSNT